MGPSTSSTASAQEAGTSMGERGSARLDGPVVHLDHIGALLGIRLGSRILHVLERFVLRDDPGQREEGRLQDGIGALAHADLFGQVNGVDGVELDVVARDVAFGLGVQHLVELVGRPAAVDHEHAAGLHVVDHAEALNNVGRVVACDEVGLVHVIATADGLITEAQVADGDAARLLRIVLEVRLNVLIGGIADDLDRVLVGAHRSVAAQTPELALDGAGSRGVGGVGILGKRQVRHIVDDPDGEFPSGSVLAQLVVHGEHRRRGRVLRSQAVTTSHGDDVGTALFVQGTQHVQVQRLSDGAGLFSAIHHRDLFYRRGKRLHEPLGDEGAVQAHLHQTHLLALGVQVVHHFLAHIAERAHRHDHAIGVGCAVVVEQTIIGAQLFVDPRHILLDDGRQLVVLIVACLAVLEEDVAVFVRTARGGMLGIQRMVPERPHRVHIDHVGEIGIVPRSDFLDLVGRTETVEEVEEGGPSLDGGEMGNCGKVHDLLHVALGKHAEPGLAAGHDVGMIAEDVERMRRNRAGAYMKHAGKALGGDLVHVGNHEKQALRCGVGGCDGAGGKRTVHRAGGAGFAFELGHAHRGAEDILATVRRPLVDVVGHRT